MLFDDRGTAPQRRAREAVLVLLGSAIVASTLAVATASGAAVYRRMLPRHGVPIRLAAALTTTFTGGALTLGLLDLATKGTRRRLSGIDRISPKSRPADEVRSGAVQEDAAPTLTDAEVLKYLERDVALDAADRAATAAWCRPYRYKSDEDGFLTSRDRWQGHPDGTASLPLVAGCTLRFEPRTPEDPGDWSRVIFVLDNNGTRVEVDTPAALLAHFSGQGDLSDLAQDDADLYDECGAVADEGA